VLSSPDLIQYGDKPTMIVKSGKVVLRFEKDRNDIDEKEEKEDDSENNVILIENFIESVSDFIKYLAVTAKANTFENAMKEFEDNIINNSGNSIQQDIIKLLQARGAIKEYIYLPKLKKAVKNPITESIIIQLFMDVVKKYSTDTSRNIYRQMRSKIDEPNTRKNEVLDQRTFQTGTLPR